MSIRAQLRRAPRAAVALLGAALCLATVAALARTPVVRLTVETSIARSEARECSRCHSMEMSLWIDHPHSRALLLPGQDNFSGIFNRRGKGYEEYVKGAFAEEDVSMAFGVTRYQVYWTRTDGGQTLLPALWDTTERAWRPLLPFLEKIRQQGILWEKGCAGCHSTGYDPQTATFHAPAVSCRACHGDGEAHMESGGMKPVARPTEYKVERSSEVCGSCHARGVNEATGSPFPVGYTSGMRLEEVFTLEQPVIGETTEIFWPDGTERSFYMEFQGFLQSGHAKAGLSCVTCHLPHGSTNERGLRRKSAEMCMGCHPAGEDIAHTAHPEGKAGCVDCHMTIVNLDVEEIHAHTHTFRFLSPENTLKWAMPNSCTTECHRGKDAAWAVEAMKEWEGK